MLLSFVYVGLFHILATIVLVYLRSPTLSRQPWATELNGWRQDSGGNLITQWILRPLINIGADNMGADEWWLRVIGFAIIAVILHKLAKTVHDF